MKKPQYKKKTFEEFINTLKRTNIDPGYYYTDYQRVAEHIQKFNHILNQFSILKSKEEFINKFKEIYAKDNSAIEITPLFTGVRPDKLVVIEKGKHVEKFNEKSISFKEAIDFLDEVGFLERIDEMAPFDIKSYFFGVNVGLDSNGRKNRAGKQMENLVYSYLKPLEDRGLISFIAQSTLESCNRKWGTSFKLSLKKQKKYDFIVKNKEHYYFIETNFFNTSGSKTDINTRFITLNNQIRQFKNAHLIVITDGEGLKKAKTEIEDVFNNLDVTLNIDDLERGLLEKVLL